MEKFEFVAVLLSIIFGMALTNLLSGMLRAFFKKELTGRSPRGWLAGNIVTRPSTVFTCTILPN